MYKVYILYSNQYDKYYIGQTQYLEKRLKRHNAGHVPFTSKYIPWELEIDVAKESRQEALKLEQKLKNLSKDRLRRFIEKYRK